MIDSPIGYYKVGDQVFPSKARAFIYATGLGTGEKASYHYYDDVWDAALSTYRFNPAVPLEDLYKQRAQQLRDNYDYLILNFSGGADSTTILETFLKNNIKLDEIYVRWPKRLVDSGVYVPNMMDKSPTNMLSEWDYSINPKLEYVRQHHPDIKIVIHDWIDTVQQVEITEDLVFKQNHNFGLANFGFSETVSENAVQLGDRGKKVANIYGIDKPIVIYNSHTKKFSMCFADLALVTSGFQHAHGLVDPNSRVNFYYAPDMPEIHLARAYTVAHYMNDNPDLLPLIDAVVRSKSTLEEITKKSYSYDKIANSICYPSWDLNTFQVDKPNNFNKIYHPWFYWLHDSSEFDYNKKKLDYTLTDISHGIDDSYKIIRNNKMLSLQMVATKHFYLNI